MPDPTLRELMNVCADAAVVAGRRSLGYFGLKASQLGVEAKGDDTPVTVADRLVEDVCRAELSRRYPSHTIKGEEREDHVGDDRFTWFIDPIDGTKSFVQGVPLYGTLVACLVDGVSRVGAIYLPALNELMVAADGEGCWHDGRRSRCSKVTDIAEATITAGSITRAIDRSDAYRDLADRAKLNRGWGDAFGYALVATGRSEAMIDPKISPWDCAAMPPIFREAGGWCGNWDGQQDIHGPDWLACAAGLKDEVLAALQKHPNRDHWGS
ncbi:MAG: inositol monophosphatase family protein [Planctomycetota bacterium]